jgi:hypothetical protein
MTKAFPLIVVSVLLFAFSNLQGESQCPGNTASVRYHFLGRSQIAIPVTINGTGPYEFMVDTGSQLTIIDPSLASELRLEPQGSIGVTAISSHSQAELVLPEKVEAASHSVSKLLVAVSSLGQVQAANPKVRGLLGENFLARFDLLIDYGHKVVCLDDGERMRQALQGERIPLEAQPNRQSDIPFTQPYLIAAHLAGTGKQNSLLRLDSGSDNALVYHDYGDKPSWIPGGHTLSGNSIGAAQQSYRALASEDVKIGSLWLRGIRFVTPTTAHYPVQPGQDGLLPTSLFHRVFLSYADHFAIFDPK